LKKEEPLPCLRKGGGVCLGVREKKKAGAKKKGGAELDQRREDVVEKSFQGRKQKDQGFFRKARMGNSKQRECVQGR